MLKRILLLTILTSANCTPLELTFRKMSGELMGQSRLDPSMPDYKAVMTEIRNFENELCYKGHAWTQMMMSLCGECTDRSMNYRFTPQPNQKDGSLEVMVAISEKRQVGIYIYDKYYTYYTVNLDQEILDDWSKPEYAGLYIRLDRNQLPIGLVQILENDRTEREYLTTVIIKCLSNDEFSICSPHFAPIPDEPISNPKDVEFYVIKETGCVQIVPHADGGCNLSIVPNEERIVVCLGTNRALNMPIWAREIYDILNGFASDMRHAINKEAVLTILSTIPDDLGYATRVDYSCLEIILNNADNPDDITYFMPIYLISTEHSSYGFCSKNSEVEFMPNADENRDSLKTLLINLFVRDVPIDAIMRIDTERR